MLLGGYGVRGRGETEAAAIMATLRAVASAGAFSIVIEKTPNHSRADITAQIDIPRSG